MNRIIDLIFNRKRTVITLFLLVFAYGVYAYFVIPKQDMPELDTPYMVIEITAPSVSASDMKNDIIEDIEKVILTFDDVTTVSSTIYDSFSYIIVEMSYSVDEPNKLSLSIFEKINELSLPSTIQQVSYTSDFSDPHIIYALHSSELSDLELLQHANQLKNDLILQDDISEVTVEHVFQNEVVITLDTTLMQQVGLNIQMVYDILLANSINIPLGGIQTEYGLISVTGNTSIDDIVELQNMIIIPEIEQVSSRVLLEDISSIEIKDTSTKIYEFNGNNAVFVSVQFKDDIDFTKLGDDVTSIIDTYLVENETSALNIDEMLFLPQYVDEQINNVFYSLLLAIAVVFIVVLIGVGVRNSILIIITIPLIIFGTIGILYLANFELHKLTIVGLIVAIGILVDNSIVITEGIKRNIDLGLPKTDASKKAIMDNFWPVLSSTLTTIAAFIVIVLLPGFLGRIVGSMPLTVIIAISISYIVSMILSPVIAILFLKPQINQKKESSIHEKNIKNMIGFTIRFPVIWILVSTLLTGLFIYISFTNQPLDLYPNDERSVLYIDFESTELSNLNATDGIKEEILTEIIDNDHVLGYASSIGGNLPNFHFSAKFINELPHIGRLYILFDYNEKDLLEYQKDLEKAFSNIENAIIKVNTLELSPPVPDLRVTLDSSNVSTLDEVSAGIFNEISALDSVKSFNVVENIKAAKYIVHYDFEAISQAFLTKAEIASFISYNLNGYNLETFTFNDDIINISINTNIGSIQDIESLVIYSNTLDTYLPLSQFITIEYTEDYAVIHRQNSKDVAYIDLYYTAGSDLQKLEEDVEEITNNYELQSVRVSYSGENAMFEEISSDLIKASIIAIILIYIVMFIQFNNFVKPLIVYATIPLSFGGSFLFLYLFNSPITATSLIGMVSLIGVTVNNGILLVEYITRRHKEGMFVRDACIESVYLRFRPIMLTSATTILGLIPLLLSGGNFFRPLAITFMGGMISSTLLTLFVVPSIYYLIYKPRKNKDY